MQAECDTQEILRRLLNCSVRLDWKDQVAPVVTQYMGRMMQCGYSEQYRKKVLVRAIRIYDKMREDDTEGTRPLYRQKTWQADSRRKAKATKKHNWSSKGGKIAPIFVPPTPNGELASELRKIAESESESGVMFNIIEAGGRAVKSILQKSNPSATPGCADDRCIACRSGRGEGGDCRASGINYEFECQMCPADTRSKYFGESSRNLFSRGMEHLDNYRRGSAKSFIKKHQNKEHGGMPESYIAKVTGRSRDCLTRQVTEAVHIRRSEVPVLNGKTEWHQPPLWRIQNEIYRG